jgi:hypothetical protein
MPLPEIKFCLVCEDIRLERRNLNSYMGVYGATPYVGIKVKNLNLPVHFVLVFMGAPANGKFMITTELRNSNGARIEAEIMPERSEVKFAMDKGGSTIAFRYKATFGRPDSYTVVLMADGKGIFQDTFTLLPATDADFT